MARQAEKPEIDVKSGSGTVARSHPGAGASPADAAQPKATRERTSQAAPPLEIDDSGAPVCYANFCRVTATPEELTIDLGFNHEAFRGPSQRVAVAQRIVVNYYTAKRMLQALGLAVERHEMAFGVLETDVRRRMRTAARAPAPAAQPNPPAAPSLREAE